jgi:predicted RNase H-like HicB family nuclease
MSTNSTEYVVRVHDAEDGTLWAEVVDLPGCFATGDNLDELRESLEEAIPMYLSERSGDKAAQAEQPAPAVGDAPGRAMSVSELRVTVPA